MRWYIAIAIFLVTVAGTIYLHLKEKSKDGEKGKKGKKGTAAVAFILGSIISVLTVFLYPANNNVQVVPLSEPPSEDSSPSSPSFHDSSHSPPPEPQSPSPALPEPEVLIQDEYRFDLYDDTVISEKIDAINAELLKENGLTVDVSNLKSFIYIMNGDYSLAENIYRDLDDILTKFANVDYIVTGNLPLFNDSDDDLSFLDDERSPLTTLPDIFRREADYYFVKAFTEAHNRVYDVAYDTLSLVETKPYVDTLFGMFVDAFMNRRMLAVPDGTVINVANVNAEAKHYVLSVIMPSNMQMAIHHGEDYEVIIDDIRYPYHAVFEHLASQSDFYSINVAAQFR